ncbi:MULTISPECIES: MurR/RpiR family transcriptional regulator [unclassified Rhizobacter]|uniref:MurR/RpiR family transcriptional regulator n=1 Tax=unclassified Rhizobacter TaxID=2640088 RepID=UPI0006F6368D|nr:MULTISPECIES: MurR/RpiR family transcriptional regulator [unclassified Rhizobacter]KQU74612.1 transcriptional regulator [Rhizobacter sp. Root29]KQW13431.1 transcriptional regulator [Rhizobacter sp. Root1238]KRB23064.1 transcriptional regulator [Rhizobacter sp. Root16D2]
MTRATSYDELKAAIEQAYPELPQQLQRIARYALDQPNELALGTVAAVAESAKVQPSSLIRFANALEFKGFSEMQQVFRGHLVERSGSYRERIDRQRRQGQPATKGAGLLSQFVGDAVSELGQLEESVRAADLSAAIKLVCAAPRVHVLAQRRAFPVACYLAYALSQLDLRVHLLDGVGGMLQESLRNLERGELLIAASFHSYSQEVVDAAASVHARGVRVIAITDSALSPLKPSATVCFELGLASDRPFRSLVAPLCLSQALVVGAGHQLAEAGKVAKGRNRSS